MADEEKVFTILGVVRWNYVVSRVLGASGKPERDTPQVIRVKCRRCGTAFKARESESGRPGTFLGTLGGMHITCAKCEAEETVANAAIPG